MRFGRWHFVTTIAITVMISMIALDALGFSPFDLVEYISIMMWVAFCALRMPDRDDR